MVCRTTGILVLCPLHASPPPQKRAMLKPIPPYRPLRPHEKARSQGRESYNRTVTAASPNSNEASSYATRIPMSRQSPHQLQPASRTPDERARGEKKVPGPILNQTSHFRFAYFSSRILRPRRGKEMVSISKRNPNSKHSGICMGFDAATRFGGGIYQKKEKRKTRRGDLLLEEGGLSGGIIVSPGNLLSG